MEIFRIKLVHPEFSRNTHPPAKAAPSDEPFDPSPDWRDRPETQSAGTNYCRHDRLRTAAGQG